MIDDVNTPEVVNNYRARAAGREAFMLEEDYRRDQAYKAECQAARIVLEELKREPKFPTNPALETVENINRAIVSLRSEEERVDRTWD